MKMSSVFSVSKMAEFLRFCKIVESCLHLTFNVTGGKNTSIKRRECLSWPTPHADGQLC